MLLAAVVLVTCCGCVEHSTSGNTHTFYNALWATGACFVGGIVATIGGWYLRTVSERLGWALMIGGVLAFIGGTPTLFFEKTTVSDEGFFVRTGVWGMSSYDVKYADTMNMNLTKEITTGRRGSKNTHFYLVCSPKSGEAQKVPINGTFEEALEFVVIGAKARNIPIIDSTGGF